MVVYDRFFSGSKTNTSEVPSFQYTALEMGVITTVNS